MRRGHQHQQTQDAPNPFPPGSCPASLTPAFTHPHSFPAGRKGQLLAGSAGQAWLCWTTTQPAVRERPLLPPSGPFCLCSPSTAPTAGLGFSPQQHSSIAPHIPLSYSLCLQPIKKKVVDLHSRAAATASRMKHSPNKDISASHGSPFHTRGSGEGDATEPKTSRGDPAVGEEAERSQSCILPVPQSKPVMEPFKEPRRKILPAQHDAVPLTGAESSAPAQIHSRAKNRHHPPLCPQCVT